MIKSIAMTLVAATLTLTAAMAQTVAEVDVIDAAAKRAERDGTLNAFRASCSVQTLRAEHERIVSLDIACDQLMKTGRAALVRAKTKEQRDPLIGVLNSLYAIRHGSGMSTVPMDQLQTWLLDSRREVARLGCTWNGSRWIFKFVDSQSAHRLDEHERFCPCEQASKRMAVAHTQTADAYRRVFGRPDATAAEVVALTAAVVRDAASGSGSYPRSLAGQLVAAAAAVR